MNADDLAHGEARVFLDELNASLRAGPPDRGRPEATTVDYWMRRVRALRYEKLRLRQELREERARVGEERARAARQVEVYTACIEDLSRHLSLAHASRAWRFANRAWRFADRVRRALRALRALAGDGGPARGRPSVSPSPGRGAS